VTRDSRGIVFSAPTRGVLSTSLLVARGWLDCLVFSWVFNLACSSTEAMTAKPACGDDPSVDDKELAVAVEEDEEEPLAVDQSKKMPKRSRRFGRVTRGVPSCSKRQRTNTYINLDVRL
jgi:hypothetical protein